LASVRTWLNSRWTPGGDGRAGDAGWARHRRWRIRGCRSPTRWKCSS